MTGLKAEVEVIHTTDAINPAPLGALTYDASGSGASSFFEVFGASDCDDRSIP